MSVPREANTSFWAKTTPSGQPGISVREHCFNVGLVAREILTALPPRVIEMLPGTQGQATTLLAALHDVGKITLGFQTKCPTWLATEDLPACNRGHITLSVSDHAFVSQAFLQSLPVSDFSPLWAVAVGAHHGRPKGRKVQLGGSRNPIEVLPSWANDHRLALLHELEAVFGPLPTTPPQPRFVGNLSDLWLLAGLITMADWIGSNESWFPPTGGLTPEQATEQARAALRQIGWPGGRLRRTTFGAAFDSGDATDFVPNAIQDAVADAMRRPGVVVVEGPMGCGKTEAALFAAQQLIAEGHQHGIYFALPTQLTSNRIYRRIEQFLRNSLSDDASLRLAHGSAWLEDDFDLRLTPTYRPRNTSDAEETVESVREARSWFASGKRALLAPYGVGTIDQALQAVVAVKHFFVRRFALAGKVIIIDEIHSYDIYTGTLVTALIRELVNLQCSVIILSATLTTDRRRELLAAAGATDTESSAAYPLITSAPIGAPVLPSIAPEWPDRAPITLRAEVITESSVIAELIDRAEDGQCVMWIRNTVIEAQQAFRAIAGSIREGTVRVGLLHSRFPFARRAQLEDEWLERLGKTRAGRGPGSILIATQVVEQSVDIDLDFIVSDLAPTDMLLQRVGRLWRHERGLRAASVPEFWIRYPDLAEGTDARALKKALGRSARVYAPYVLLRTTLVWQGRESLRLPVDIRPMLEATYAAPASDEPDGWKELHAELEAEKRELIGNAEAMTRVLGSPMLDDGEEILTRRRGAPVIPVTILRSFSEDGAGNVTATALDGSQAHISAYDWRRESARFTHQWTVRAPRWMLPAQPLRPRWLSLHGAFGATVVTVGDDGRCQSVDTAIDLHYDAHLGVYASRPTNTTPRQADDDEFDS